MFNDEHIIENIIESDQEDEVEDDDTLLELVLHKDTLNATIILHNIQLHTHMCVCMSFVDMCIIQLFYKQC